MAANYGIKIKLCYMDTKRFVYKIETDNFNKGIVEDVETGFDACGHSKESSYQ